MPSYITAVNDLIARESARVPVLYGENINTGSRISGLTRNLKVGDSGRIINVGDCELTHCGVGFGLMMNGVSSVLFAKQLDFMLLGIDHFVSTYNFIRALPAQPLASFTIITIVCDHGHQGPQSSFNGLGDLSSLAGVPGYALTNASDAEHILRHQIGAPGFRIIALSQRLFPTDVIATPAIFTSPDSALFQYAAGQDATIVCLNFSLPYGIALGGRLARNGRSASLFSANYVPSIDWQPVIESVVRTGSVIVLDDSKSVTSAGHALLTRVAEVVPSARRAIHQRPREIPFGIDPEVYPIDYDALAESISVGVRASR